MGVLPTILRGMIVLWLLVAIPFAVVRVPIEIGRAFWPRRPLFVRWLYGLALAVGALAVVFLVCYACGWLIESLGWGEDV